MEERLPEPEATLQQECMGIPPLDSEEAADDELVMEAEGSHPCLLYVFLSMIGVFKQG